MKILRPYTVVSGVVAATAVAVITIPGAAHASSWPPPSVPPCVTITGTTFSFNCSIPTNPGGVTGTVTGSGSSTGGSGSYTFSSPGGSFSGLFSWPAFTTRF